MNTNLKVTLALGLALFASGVLACGDSLYRVGKGVTYRTYSAPLPGNLLIYGSSNGTEDLAEQLARSGHGVHIAGSLDELSAELQKGGYDVVIASFDDRITIESTPENQATFLPVAFSKEQQSLARAAYGQVMVPDKHEIKHYLKAIHRSLKSRA